MRTIITTLAILAVLSVTALADTWHLQIGAAISSGGLVTGAAYKINGAAGQPIAGFVGGPSNMHWIGLWAADIVAPTVVARLSSAKLLPNGTWISISGKIATTSRADFSGFFYTEESDRTSGILIAVPASLPEISRGSSVNLIGTLGTASNGERVITASVVIVAGAGVPLKPLGMANVMVAGGDVGSPPSAGQYGATGASGTNNVGLLISTWGRVTYVDNSYMLLSDGSPAGVKVETTHLAQLPTLGSYVSVFGISSLQAERTTYSRYILLRDDQDWTQRQSAP